MKIMKPQNTEELTKYRNEYSEPKLWNKLGRFAGRLGKEVVFQVLVLYYAMMSPDVSIKNKSIVIGALGYLILPLDLLPDFIPLLGFTDDAAAIAMAYKAVKSSITPAIELQARNKLNDWF